MDDRGFQIEMQNRLTDMMIDATYAFPQNQIKRCFDGVQGQTQYGMFGGLTKRELFAAMAMQGMVGKRVEMDEQVLAEYAVKWADALIKELSSTPDRGASATESKEKDGK